VVAQRPGSPWAYGDSVATRRLLVSVLRSEAHINGALKRRLGQALRQLGKVPTGTEGKVYPNVGDTNARGRYGSARPLERRITAHHGRGGVARGCSIAKAPLAQPHPSTTAALRENAEQTAPRPKRVVRLEIRGCSVTTRCGWMFARAGGAGRASRRHLRPLCEGAQE
jgi:hypothetical protein